MLPSSSLRVSHYAAISAVPKSSKDRNGCDIPGERPQLARDCERHAPRSEFAGGARVNDEELTSHFENVDLQLETIDRRFDAVDQRFEHMEAFVREEGAATRRHMDVIADGLRAEIKLIAEGHTALVTSLATLASRHERTEETR
jgi:hypothetical protein